MSGFTTATARSGNASTMNLMTLKEVAEELRIPEATLRYWRQRGDGPHGFRIGGRVVFRRAAVEDWVAGCESASSGRPTSAAWRAR